MIKRLCFWMGILLIIGGILSVFLIPGKLQAKIDRCTEETTGMVTHVHSFYSDDEKRYDTTIRFEIHGNVYEDSKTLKYEKSVGDTFLIKYNPENIPEIYIEGVDDDPKTVKIMGIIFLVAGVICLTVGINEMVNSKK